jgi:hypothetical protein
MFRRADAALRERSWEPEPGVADLPWSPALVGRTWAGVAERVRSRVDAALRCPAWTALAEAVWDSLPAAPPPPTNWRLLWDLMRSPRRLASYHFLHCVCSFDCSDLRPLWEAARHCHWFVVGKTLCHLSERPVAVRLEGGTPARTDGPVVRYADGFEAGP